MLNPYWRTIAPTVVNELRRRPQVIQLMAELLSITTADFLQLTQVHTIPYLVLNQRREILSRVAESSGLPLRDMCLLHNNLASILAHILLKTSGDLKASVSSVLGTISSDFSGMECAELIRAEPILIASELLKVAGECLSQDNPEVRFSSFVEVCYLNSGKIHAALQFLASVTCGRQPTSRTTARKTDSIGPFFDFYILGILAHLTNTINDGRVHQSLPEKRRCLGAIRAMMDIAGNNISSALPQVCSLFSIIASVEHSLFTRFRLAFKQQWHKSKCAMRHWKHGMSCSKLSARIRLSFSFILPLLSLTSIGQDSIQPGRVELI